MCLRACSCCGCVLQLLLQCTVHSEHQQAPRYFTPSTRTAATAHHWLVVPGVHTSVPHPVSTHGELVIMSSTERFGWRP